MGLEGSGFVGWVWRKFSGVEPVSERGWSEALIPPEPWQEGVPEASRKKGDKVIEVTRNTTYLQQTALTPGASRNPLESHAKQRLTPFLDYLA